MSRYFEKITEQQLYNKIEETLKLHGNNRKRGWKNLTPQVRRDLSKCNFDTENLDEKGSFGRSELVGYHTLPNGFTFNGISAGGDWEIPVFFIIYWDGTQLRGYIPKKGNPWNTTTGYPYGNDDVADGRNLKKRYSNMYVGVKPDDCDSSIIHCEPDLVIQDIIDEIEEK